jgi:hypothetical protein
MSQPAPVKTLKLSDTKDNQSSSSIPTTCTSLLTTAPPSSSNVNTASTSDESDNDVQLTKVTEGVTNKHALLGDLDESHFEIIISPTG